MLSRRSFLRKAGLAAGAALVALGLRDVPGAKAKDLHTLWLDVTPTKAIATVVGRGPIIPRLDHLGMTANLGELNARWDTAHYTLYLDESALEGAGKIAREVQALFASLPALDDILITPETLRAANEAWARRVSDA